MNTVNREEYVSGVGTIVRDDRVLFSDIAYKLTIWSDGSAIGEIHSADTWLAWYVATDPNDWLQLRLSDGRLMFFQLRRAEGGTSGDVVGRLVPPLPNSHAPRGCRSL